MEAGAGNGDGKMALSGAGTADQHGIALVLEEGASGEITYQALIDWPPAVGRTAQELGASLVPADRGRFVPRSVVSGECWRRGPALNMAKNWSE